MLSALVLAETALAGSCTKERRLIAKLALAVGTKMVCQNIFLLGLKISNNDIFFKFMLHIP